MLLANSYKRYKADTSRLIHWLCTSSRKLGHEVTPKVLASSTSPVRNKTGSQKATDGRQQRYSITIQQVKGMAKYIAQVGAEVPESVITFAQRAIKVRKGCAEWFRQLEEDGGANNKKNKDLGHNYFIKVLEDVVEMLSPLSVSVKPVNSETAAESTNEEDRDEIELLNRFDLLEVEQVAEEDQDAETMGSTTLPVAMYEVETDREDDDSERYFVLFSLFEDLNDLRDFIRETWEDFRAGKIDLITASVTTNSAVDLVRDMGKEVAEKLPKAQSYVGASSPLYVYASVCRGSDPVQSGIALEMFDVADFLMVPTYMTLEALVPAIPEKAFPFYNGQFGWYNPLASRRDYDIVQQMEEDRLILMEAMPDLVMMARFQLGNPLKDELTKEFGLYAKSKQIPLVLVFAAQLYIDINNVLRERAAVGLTLLRLAGSQVSDSLKRRAAVNPTVPNENWPAQNEMVVQQFQHYIDTWIKGDRLHTERQKLVAAIGVKTKLQSYSLMRRHPWLCGLMQFKLYLSGQDLGVTMANAWGTITYTAHLYEACKYSGKLADQKWDDMDFVLDANGKERMFKGRIPSNPEESLKSFCFMVGTSVVEFVGTERVRKARERRGRLRESCRGPTGLTDTTPVSTNFRKRVCEDTEDTVFTADAIDKMLHGSTKLRLVRQKWARSRQLSPLQLLVTLRAGLLAERDLLRFDYIGMHARCLVLLRELHTAVDPTFKRCIGDDYMEDERQLAWLPGWVFLLLSELGRDRVKRGEQYEKEGVLTSCADVLTDCIKREGRVECSALRKF